MDAGSAPDPLRTSCPNALAQHVTNSTDIAKVKELVRVMMNLYAKASYAQGNALL
jgi:hypothetical protein